MIMIYILRTLWILGYFPVLLMQSITLVLSLATYPLVMGIYYVIRGEIETLKYSPGTIPEYIGKQYDKLKKLIEKRK